MESLLKKHAGLTLFLIDFTNDDFYSRAEFKVFKVTGWGVDDEIIEKELYLEGFIKWDGCSDIWFGGNSAIHFCGEHHFQLHKQVLDALWLVCSKKIINWDNDVATY